MFWFLDSVTLLDRRGKTNKEKSVFSFVLTVCPEAVWQDAAMPYVMVAARERPAKVILF